LAGQVSIVVAKYNSIVVECQYFNIYYYLSSEGIVYFVIANVCCLVF